LPAPSDAAFAPTLKVPPICPPEGPLIVSQLPLEEAVTAKASFSAGELFTGTLCGVALPPVCAVSAIGPGWIRLGQSEHVAEMLALEMPRVVESPGKVPDPVSYVPELPAAMLALNATGTGAGNVPAGSRTVALNDVVFKVKVHSVTFKVPLPSPAIETATVAAGQVNWNPPAINVIGRLAAENPELLYVIPTVGKVVVASNVAPSSPTGSSILAETTAVPPTLHVAVPPAMTVAVVGGLV
jgi:hypothetical protein